jgi:hypothetical protein
MAKKTYHGSCQCRHVQFEVDLDLSLGTAKCNCTSCWKRRHWSARALPEDFRPLGDETELSGFESGKLPAQSGFCKHCGVSPYNGVPVSEWNPEPYVSITVSCLDDLDPAELIAAPVTFMDGRADNWWEAPAETRHL